MVLRRLTIIDKLRGITFKSKCIHGHTTTIYKKRGKWIIYVREKSLSASYTKPLFSYFGGDSLVDTIIKHRFPKRLEDNLIERAIEFEKSSNKRFLDGMRKGAIDKERVMQTRLSHGLPKEEEYY